MKLFFKDQTFSFGLLHAASDVVPDSGAYYGRRPSTRYEPARLSEHTYAATARTCSEVSGAPPFGGIGAGYCMGFETPFVTVLTMNW